MSGFVREAAAPAEDKTASIALSLVSICLINLVLALSYEPFARALELMGRY
jgi:hypothetical protein